MVLFTTLIKKNITKVPSLYFLVIIACLLTYARPTYAFVQVPEWLTAIQSTTESFFSETMTASVAPFSEKITSFFSSFTCTVTTFFGGDCEGVVDTPAVEDESTKESDTQESGEQETSIQHNRFSVATQGGVNTITQQKTITQEVASPVVVFSTVPAVTSYDLTTLTKQELEDRLVLFKKEIQQSQRGSVRNNIARQAEVSSDQVYDVIRGTDTAFSGASLSVTGAITGGTITATSFIGDGSLLTGLPAGYDAVDFAVDFANMTTDDLAEGTVNLYFSDARAIDALTGQNISLLTNDAGYLDSEADTFQTVTDRGATTSQSITAGGLTLSNITSGSILFAGTSGLTSQDNTNFFWNDTNNQLLLGDGTALLPAYSFGSDPNTGIFRAGADSLSFTTGGAARWNISSSGTLNGANNFLASRIMSIGGSGSASAPIFSFGSGLDEDTGMYRVATDTLGFTTGGTERLRIDATGLSTFNNNIGINTTANTTFNIDAVGATRSGFRFTSGTRSLSFSNFASDLNYLDSSGANLRIRTTDATGIEFWLNNARSVSFAAAGNAHFGTPNTLSTGFQFSVQPTIATNVGLVVRGFTSQTAALQQWQDSAGTVLGTFTAGGNLGIGTSSPTSSLSIGSGQIEVSTGSAAAPSYSFTGDLDTGIYSGAANTITFSANGANQLMIGIGAVYTGNGGRFASGVGSVATPSYGYTSAGGLGMYFPTTSSLALVTNTAERLRIDSSGNVGIGTTAPSARLHIDTVSAASTGLIVRGVSGQTANLLEWQNNAGTILGAIDASGNTTIGTSGGTRKLTVVENSSSVIPIGIRNDSAQGFSGIHFLNNANQLMGHMGYANASAAGALSDKFYFGSIASKDLVLTTNDAVRMTVTSAGNVGIGNTSPAYSLSVAGTGEFTGTWSNGQIRVGSLNQGGMIRFVRGSDASALGWIGYDSTTSGFMLNIRNGGGGAGVSISSAAGEVARFASTGNMGVGTTSPQQRLHVVRTDDGAPVRFEDASGYCEINPTNTAWTCTSDERLKENVVTLDREDVLTKINQLNPVSFSWISDEQHRDRRGLIAQEVEQIFPDLVNTDGETGLKSVSYGGFTAYFISAIQELTEKITSLFDGSGRVKVQEICVGETCVTEDVLINLLEENNINTSTPITTGSHQSGGDALGDNVDSGSDGQQSQGSDGPSDSDSETDSSANTSSSDTAETGGDGSGAESASSASSSDSSGDSQGGGGEGSGE